MPSEYLPLPGSRRELPRGVKEYGKVDQEERVNVTVVVRNRSFGRERLAVELLGRQAPGRRRYIDRLGFARRYGASDGDLVKVQAFARDNGLRVREVSAAKRVVVISGSVAELSSAFRVELRRYRHPKGIFRGRRGEISLPQELAPAVKAVLGLDNRPQADAHFRTARAAGGKSYPPTQVGEVYDYPSELDGTGQSVGIIELGGGYDTKDLQAYFSGIGVEPPIVVSVPVDGGSNSPTGSANGPDAEVLLDIEVVGSLAPGAGVAVYFAPNTDAGFVDALLAAIHDAKNKPSVVSISWGSAESTWTQQGMDSLNQALQDASLLGTTVCVASGDGGSSDGVKDGLAHVDFPASSEYALGCGGTRLSVSGTTAVGEVVWNDQPSGGATGGGISDYSSLPDWQAKAGVPASANPGGRVGRGVPDVCGDADPQTGYLVLVDGKKMVVGGTSAVAPLWAALLARLNQGIGKPVGYVNPILYSMTGGAFHDITSGNNGAYKAGRGWDACTGLGRPDGTKLLEALSA